MTTLLRSTQTVTGAVLLAGAAALGACASTGGGAGDLSTPESDRILYESKCGVCHVPFGREDFDAAEWPAIVATFAPRAGLTASQRVRVLRHLTAR